MNSGLGVREVPLGDAAFMDGAAGNKGGIAAETNLAPAGRSLDGTVGGNGMKWDGKAVQFRTGGGWDEIRISEREFSGIVAPWI